MGLPARFRVNAPGVIGESVDGEVLIVNLDTGSYYSASGSGDAIWQLAVEGADATAIVRELAAAHDANPEMVAQEVQRFLGELVAEGLLIEDSERGTADEPPTTGPANVAAAGAAFERPLLNKYTDMQDLLLLDPVHEVDSAGWPAARLPG